MPLRQCGGACSIPAGSIRRFLAHSETEPGAVDYAQDELLELTTEPNRHILRLLAEWRAAFWSVESLRAALEPPFLFWRWT